MPGTASVRRAIRLTYAQMMLNSIFGASTGGMFLVGFAMALGADNVLLGVMGTVPQFFVVFQFVGAYLVESGISRKKLTIVFAFVAPLAWFLVAAIPLFASVLSRGAQFAILVGVIALVTIANQFAGSARGSWIGELIPERIRGKFFGYSMMFAGIIGAAFAVAEGRFLEVIKSHGLFAFTGLFFFGSLFGIVSAALNIPQPDCPLPGAESKTPYLQLIRRTFKNRPFVTLALVHAAIALGGIAGPFNAAYCLRDVGLGYFGLGVLNTISTLALVASSPLWGKVTARHGCRPVLITGLALLTPLSLVWLGIPPGAAARAYRLLPWTNVLGGIGSAAVSVSISTMVYKTSFPEGRSVQFALYSTFVTLVGAPMPIVGGWLVSALDGAGWTVDLRLTFYLWSLFIFVAFLLAQRLTEEGAISTRVLVFNYLPRGAADWFASSRPTVLGIAAWRGLASMVARQGDENGADGKASDQGRGA